VLDCDSIFLGNRLISGLRGKKMSFKYVASGAFLVASILMWHASTIAMHLGDFKRANIFLAAMVAFGFLGVRSFWPPNYFKNIAVLAFGVCSFLMWHATAISMTPELKDTSLIFAAAAFASVLLMFASSWASWKYD